jgi:hypothetical protein
MERCATASAEVASGADASAGSAGAMPVDLDMKALAGDRPSAGAMLAERILCKRIGSCATPEAIDKDAIATRRRVAPSDIEGATAHNIPEGFQGWNLGFGWHEGEDLRYLFVREPRTNRVAPDKGHAYRALYLKTLQGWETRESNVAWATIHKARETFNKWSEKGIFVFYRYPWYDVTACPVREWEVCGVVIELERFAASLQFETSTRCEQGWAMAWTYPESVHAAFPPAPRAQMNDTNDRVFGEYQRRMAAAPPAAVSAAGGDWRRRGSGRGSNSSGFGSTTFVF